MGIATAQIKAFAKAIPGARALKHFLFSANAQPLSLYRRARWALWKLSLLSLERSGENFYITRFSMYRRLQEIAPNMPIQSGRALSISDSHRLLDFLGIQTTELIRADYPEYSLLSLAFQDSSFDFIVSDQVFEHLEGNPH
jgi:hypothetical protein